MQGMYCITQAHKHSQVHMYKAQLKALHVKNCVNNFECDSKNSTKSIQPTFNMVAPLFDHSDQ